MAYAKPITRGTCPYTIVRRRRLPALVAALVLLVLSAGAHATDHRNATERGKDETVWNSLRKAYFGDRPIAVGAGVVSLDAPERAEDPAVVPITITDGLADDPDRHIAKLWLVIDNNPTPMSARFEFGPAAASASIATRVRVNSYTYMRVIAETGDHKLFMARRFVKASGGCSAPVGTDPEAAQAHLGEMRLRRLAASGDDTGPEVQLMIRHPNLTGLQMDQLTRLVWPAHFVDSITIHKGDAMLLDSHMTFSLSENPSLRFDPSRDVDGELDVRVHDNKNNTFKQHWAAKNDTRTVSDNGKKS